VLRLRKPSRRLVLTDPPYFMWMDNRHVGQVFLPSVRTPVKTPYAVPNSVEERPPLISEGHTNFQFLRQN
jgi:hypothetical protein